MNSPPHRANILSKDFGYIGIGYYSSGNCWVQMFASREAITSCTVSTGERAFETEDAIAGEYVTCKTTDGYISYLPLDFDSMQEKDGKFLLRLPAKNLPEFTFGGTETSYMAKNKEAALAAVEAMEITNDFTQDDLDDLLLEVCIHSASQYSGPSVATDNFKLIPATADKAGSMEASVTIAENEDTIDFTVKKEIPKLTSSAADLLVDTPNETGLIDSPYYKELAAGEADKMYNNGETFLLLLYKDGCSNCVRAQTYLKTALGEKKVKVYGVNMGKDQTNFVWKFAGGGSVTTPLLVMVRSKTDVTVKTGAYTQAIIDDMLAKAGASDADPDSEAVEKPSADKEKIAADKADMITAISAMTNTNAMTKDDILEVARAAAKNGTTVDWANDYKKVDATTTAMGSIKGTLNLTLNKETLTLKVNKTIPKLLPIALAFSDVKANAYYADAVKWAVEKNITKGTSATEFSPDDTCTRAQILTFLWRAVGSPKANGANPFNDVKISDYYYDAAVWAVEKGMVSGSEFEGDTPCTRAYTVIYLWKNAGSPAAAATDTFTDVPTGAEYAQAVAWAVENGVTSGTSATTFAPDDTCTRGQIVTFLHRAIG